MSLKMKKMAWCVTYFDQIILSMSSLQTTYHNMRAANGVRSPPLESHDVLEMELKSNPQVNICIKLSGSIHVCIWLELYVCILEMHGLPIEHCIYLL